MTTFPKGASPHCFNEWVSMPADFAHGRAAVGVRHEEVAPVRPARVGHNTCLGDPGTHDLDGEGLNSSCRAAPVPALGGDSSKLGAVLPAGAFRIQ